ncbi:MAG: metallophosphoesterase [Pseudomonadota bacterium]|nr:metallophosphoesterase [Pseudomonadota bacterium]
MTNKYRNTLFRFAVIADTHITEKDAPAIDGLDQETVPLSVKRLAHIVRKLKRLSPDFVIHLRNTTHPRPDHPAYNRSAKAFYEVFKNVGCPFYLVVGNHDIGQKHYLGVPIHPEMSQGFVNNKMIAAYEEQFQKHFLHLNMKAGCL